MSDTSTDAPRKSFASRALGSGAWSMANFGLGQIMRLASNLVLTLGQDLQVSAGVRSKLDRAGVRIVTEKAAGWDFGGDRVDVRLEGGPRRFAAVYSGLGSDPQNTLARTLGAKLTADGCILTDAHQETSAEGVFAAGDVVTGLNQIAVAMAQGEIAATRIHSRLRLAEGRCVADSL